MMRFRVEVDRDLCQGHGVCESEAPTVFSVSKKGDLTILVERFDEDDDAADPALRPQIELAVRYCPTHALTLRQDDREEED